ncbi:MAG TPA: ABC transporter permease, partial [Sphaerochaeta sp.]|nr:ABC transporter permease [Sphaerochaeta sp.]
IILVIVATKMVLADPYLMEKVWRKVQKRSSKSKEVEA